MKKEIFFQNIRPMFGGKFSQSQVDGINAILTANETYRVGNRQFAYIIATVFHETDKTFQPIEEYGKGKGKLYGTNIKHDKKPYFDTKNIFYGRGHTQNTWYETYEKLTVLAQKHNWDFLNNPELLLQMQPSIWATFTAMQTGLYTGRKLSDYINTQKCDYVNARRIINGTDKAELIAEYANQFYKHLEESI